jgi:hypothetical protein
MGAKRGKFAGQAMQTPRPVVQLHADAVASQPVAVVQRDVKTKSPPDVSTKIVQRGNKVILAEQIYRQGRYSLLLTTWELSVTITKRNVFFGATTPLIPTGLTSPTRHPEKVLCRART